MQRETFHPHRFELNGPPPDLIWSKTQESQELTARLSGVQVPDKVLRYASYGGLTAGGPAQVGGSTEDVMRVLSLIRAV